MVVAMRVNESKARNYKRKGRYKVSLAYLVYKG